MADFSGVKESECLRKKKPEGCELNASHTFVLQSVINEIKEHGRSSMQREVCGVLLGNLCFDGESFLLIDARIEGKFATHQSGSVTFTSETWDYINNEREAKYPDKKIVGWYHTHPGFGIFLSNMDAFIHNNFFSMKWQSAYVFDPQAETDGFFFAKGESLEQESVVVVPDVEATFVEPKIGRVGEKMTILTEEEEGRQATHRCVIIILSVLIALLVVVDIFGFFILREKSQCAKTGNARKIISQQDNDAVNLSRQLAASSARVKDLEAEIAKLQAQLSDAQRAMTERVEAGKTKAESKPIIEPQADAESDRVWYQNLFLEITQGVKWITRKL